MSVCVGVCVCVCVCVVLHHYCLNMNMINLYCITIAPLHVTPVYTNHTLLG